VPLLNLGRLVGLVRQRACEDPAFFRRRGLLAPCEQNLYKRRIQRYMIPRILRLYVIDLPVHDAPLHEKLLTLEIEVLPLKRPDLAHAKTEALRHNHHRLESFFQQTEDGFVLLH